MTTKDLSLTKHDKHRRRHKRVAREILRKIAENENAEAAVRVAAAAALVGSPGWISNLLTNLGKAKRIGS